VSDLHQAVQAEIAARTPSLPPSFDALKHRKHRRDRRRTIAAITASALAAAGIAFVPSALGSGGTAPAQIAQDPAPAPAPAEGGRLPCDSPRMFIYTLASTTGGAATPEQAAEEFGARPNAEPGYAGQTWTRGETKANGELQLYGQTARLGTVQGSDGTWFVIAGSACPAGVAAAEQYGFHVKATDARAVLAAGQESQDAIKRCMDLPGIYNAVVQFSSPGQWTGFITGRDQADGFKRCVEAVPGWEATVKAAQQEAQDEVPAAVAAQFSTEAANHGAVEAEIGCTTETAGDRLAVEQARQKDTGAPIDGWLLEAPAETRIYVCRYEGTFQGRPGTSLAVWEAADPAAGGPRPALDFRPA
jgi:hypothetical protein